MYYKSKRSIAMFLVVAMLCTLLPVSAFAGAGTSAVHTHADEYDDNNQPRVFEKVFDPELTAREVSNGGTTQKIYSASVKTGSYYLDCDYGVNQDNLLINIEGTVHL